MSPIQRIFLEYGWALRKVKGSSSMYIGMLRHLGFHEKADEAQLVEKELCAKIIEVYIHKRSKIDPNFIP